VKQPHRLAADARHGFGGAAIDRSKPLTFRFNGRLIEAFEGDTVLSALLAAGIDTAGTLRGEPIGIDERFSPPIAPRGRTGAVAMAMDRTPAVAGADLVALGPHESPFSLGRFAPRLASLVTRGGRTAERRLDEPRLLEGAWLHATPTETHEADTIVVGGGVAGMSAALAAADAGGRVILVERRTTLGGDALFFGTVGEEEPPETVIAGLIERIASTPSINVFRSAEAFALSGTRLRVHQVRATNGELAARVMRLSAPRIVLATGAAERLPTFPGNRAPRVTGAVAAFHRAERFGVWLGRNAIFATPHNFGYRLALRAADAGIEVRRVADSRTAPQSRFVDFCKASGITLSSGLAVRSADPVPKSHGALIVTFGVTIEGATGGTEPLPADQLVAAGGWQPRLALWLMGGGSSAYEPMHRRLAARGALDGVALAGSAAGYRGTLACRRSGEHAAASLFGESPEPVDDPEVDAIYETPAGITTIAPWRAGRGAAFLDGGLSFALRPQQLKKDAPVLAPGQIQALSLGDVVAAVELGSIPVGEAGTIAQERSAGGEISDTGWQPPAASAPPPDVPAYLHGRFGSRPQSVVLMPSDDRSFEPGCLIYPNSDAGDPLVAVGVVLGPAPGAAVGARALVARAVIAEGISLFVRDTSGAVAVKVSEKLKPQAAAKPA
jgi:sarcosine oxidase subunit alpha